MFTQYCLLRYLAYLSFMTKYACTSYLCLSHAFCASVLGKLQGKLTFWHPHCSWLRMIGCFYDVTSTIFKILQCCDSNLGSRSVLPTFVMFVCLHLYARLVNVEDLLDAVHAHAHTHFTHTHTYIPMPMSMSLVASAKKHCMPKGKLPETGILYFKNWMKTNTL